MKASEIEEYNAATAAYHDKVARLAWTGATLARLRSQAGGLDEWWIGHKKITEHAGHGFPTWREFDEDEARTVFEALDQLQKVRLDRAAGELNAVRERLGVAFDLPAIKERSES